MVHGLEKNYLGVDVVVEINSSYETMCLYREFKEIGMSYVQDMSGPLIQVGEVDKRGIWVAPLIHVISGVNVLYVEATSGLVDWPMIEEWIKSKVKEGVQVLSDPGRLCREIKSIRQAIADGEVTKRILIDKANDRNELIERPLRFLKAVEPLNDYPGRQRIITTTNPDEAMVNAPVTMEELVRSFYSGYLPQIDETKEESFGLIKVY